MILIPYKRSYVFPAGQREFLNEHLETEDPEMFKIIEGEKKRQRESICLIPSEVSYTIIIQYAMLKLIFDVYRTSLLVLSWMLLEVWCKTSTLKVTLVPGKESERRGVVGNKGGWCTWRVY